MTKKRRQIIYLISGSIFAVLVYFISQNVFPIALSGRAIGEPSNDCDSEKWDHLHTKSRFRRPVIWDFPCVKITGLVVETGSNPNDGDFLYSVLNDKTNHVIEGEIICASIPKEDRP